MLTLKLLMSKLIYCNVTGVFTRKTSGGGHCSGGVSGSVDPTNGYVKIGIDGKRFYAHRLAWLYCHGEFPLNEIDHIDGDRENNSISNLRAVDHQENSKNQSLRSTNKSGFTGVSMHESGKWRAYINTKGKSKHIGLYDMLSDAVYARLLEEDSHGYHDNHGRASTRGISLFKPRVGEYKDLTDKQDK